MTRDFVGNDSFDEQSREADHMHVANGGKETPIADIQFGKPVYAYGVDSQVANEIRH
jgi:hypothetical protein